MTWVVLLIGVLLLVPALLDLIRAPGIRRLAGRNIVRRKGEAALVTLGTLLGTAIIVASLTVGDTIEDAVLSLVDTSTGELDEAVVPEDPSQLAALTDAIVAADIDDVDGLVPILSMPTAVTTTGPDPLGRPATWVAEIDFDDARAFGSDPAATGFAEAGATPRPGEVVLTTRAAGPLEAEVGDTVRVHAYGTSIDLTVSAVIERAGLAGWNNAYVAPGTIDSMWTPGAPGRPPRAEVAVSNTGNAYTGVELTDEVETALDEAIAGFDPVRVETVKRNIIEDAESDGAEFTTLFGAIGSFSVIAGILLIVNLFVMLAEERKTQLGIMRAVGYRRHQVTRSFGLEGAVYAAAAAVAGTALGAGVGWVLVRAIEGIFFEQSDTLNIAFVADPSTLALGAGIGLVISMLTIWATAVRIARFNIIAAVRDLPQPATRKGAVRSLVVGALGFLGGGAVTALGLTGEEPITTLIGVPIAAFSAITLLRRMIPERVAATAMGATALVWGVGVFTFFPGIFNESEITVFVFQGVVLVAAAIVISASARRMWTAVVDAASGMGAGLATRLGMIYPLAKRGRTGLLLAMFSLVIFTMTFLSVMAGIFDQQTGSFAEDSAAGTDISLVSASTNPADEAAILAIDGVGAATGFVRSIPEFDVEDGDTPDPRWVVTGFDESFLADGGAALVDRADEYATDEEAYRAVLADSSLIIVNDFFLDGSGGPGGERYEVGDVLTMVDPTSEAAHEVTIAGVLNSDFLFAGAYMEADFLRGFLPMDHFEGRWFVTVADGEDPGTVAARLNGQLLANGVDAATFDEIVEREVGETMSVLRLFQGFLSIGLVIGIAGLGVVLVRAVHERRRQIGVLRALGFQDRVVKRALLFEAGFLASQGVFIGIALGLVTAYQGLVNSDTFGAVELEFVWPWAALAIIFAIPTVAALLSAWAPASRASRIAPAVALRAE